MTNTSRTPASPREQAAAEEQPYISYLYERLDLLRERTTARLRDLYLQRGGTHQAIWERDAFVARDLERLERLAAVEPGLCFGRLDLVDSTRQYIGRMALSDDDYEQLLIDWRAPAAAPFYRATAANPGDVTRRRHIQTSRRRVLSVDDEVFGPGAPGADGAGTLSGEAALLASLRAPRTGRMHDIVATIQAEQDRIIRSDLRGILVVQGGPGTGKTVAALHRAAYLLYTHRDRLADQGVLIIGPNPTFLRYIEQVLPSLGETGVVLTSLGSMYPDVVATGSEPGEDLAAKGDLHMVDVLKQAVRARQRVPRDGFEVSLDGRTLWLPPDTCSAARTKARRSRRPHNQARAVFVREMLTALAEHYGGRLGYGESLSDDDIAGIRSDLAGEPAVQKALDELWPTLTPQELVADVLDDPGRITWTIADVPLLDEAAELLGPADTAPDAAALRAEAQRQADIEYARELLENLDLTMPIDPALVAERYHGPARRASTAERAVADRSWAFGHVIVDEAQELSPMAWRMVMRRCPARSMTLVGDLAQAGSPAAPSSWAEALDPHVQGRWRVEELAVNYRTPTEIMDLAAGVLQQIDPSLSLPRSVRSTGTEPWTTKVADVNAELPGLVAAELPAIGDGRLAVIVPAGRADEVLAALRGAGIDAAPGFEPAALDSPAAVLTVTQAKGLEFDSVIVVEPAELVSTSPSGLRDLYVAITRATARLGIVHTSDLAPIHSV
ncbi:MAG TPA: ATP-binding domain-containing protein [Jiangellaceae bacterium]